MIEKLVFTKDKITIKLNRGVSSIKVKDITSKGKMVTMKINQGATIFFTTTTTSKLTAKMKGIAMWTAIRYTSLEAVSIDPSENTLSIFSYVGVGFWTTYELGSIERRYK